MSRIVTAETFTDPYKANLIRSFLESEGIPCFLSDENINRIQPLFSTAVGGIRLQVRESDLEQAIQLIAGFETASDQEPVPVPDCPSCGSSQVLETPDDSYTYFQSYRCFHCDFTWDNRSDYHINPWVWE